MVEDDVVHDRNPENATGIDEPAREHVILGARGRITAAREAIGASADLRHNSPMVDERALLARITTNPDIFGGKPIVRGRRLAVEHVLGMLAAGDTAQSLLANYPWLEPEDVQACLVYAQRLVGHERVVPFEIKTGT